VTTPQVSIAKAIEKEEEREGHEKQQGDDQEMMSGKW
jgi:hypothetical protein